MKRTKGTVPSEFIQQLRSDDPLVQETVLIALNYHETLPREVLPHLQEVASRLRSQHSDLASVPTPLVAICRR